MSLLMSGLPMLVVPCILACVPLACSLIRFGVLVSKRNSASPGLSQSRCQYMCQGTHVRQLCMTRWSCWQKFLKCGCKNAIYHPTLHSTLHFQYCAQEHSLPWHYKWQYCFCVNFAGCADLNLHVLYSSSSIRYTWDEAPMLLQHNLAHKHIS